MPSAVIRSPPPPPATTKPKSPLSPRRPSISLLSRNIDTVVLGNVQFETWYYSPYPDSIILETAAASETLGPTNATRGHGQINGHEAVSAPSPSTTSTAGSTTMCPVLHVCPRCFRYTPRLSCYVAHLRHHQQLQSQEAELGPVPESATAVYSHGGYSVWEIDGETEKFYCQNLSLFGKLFLEQKSVFFDTGGFLYYVLTYTPPETEVGLAPGKRKKHSNARGNLEQENDESVDEEDELGLRTEVLGFFSKENPSWDNNNLACILIFPPYQHRQLGKLLMAVSYKLSGWEWEGGVIGGPEKPLSVMGRRSYLSFWSERVARFILGESADADGRKVFEVKGKTTTTTTTRRMKKRRKRKALKKEALTIKEIGERTGMLAEDVVAALTEMAVCETMFPKKAKVKNAGSDTPSAGAAAGGGGGGGGEDESVRMMVRRSRVVDWVQKHHVNLHDPVREEGFLGEWAMSEAADEVSDADAGTDAEDVEMEDSSSD